ncbi:unnamed protein product [Rhodiola kirilowii]
MSANKKVKFNPNVNDDRNKQKKQQHTSSSSLLGLSGVGTELRCRGFIVAFFDHLRCRISSSISVTPLIPPYANKNPNNSQNHTNVMNSNGGSGRSTTMISSTSRPSSTSSIWTTGGVRSSAPDSSSTPRRPTTAVVLLRHQPSPCASRPKPYFSTSALTVMGNIVKAGTEFKPDITPVKPATNTLVIGKKMAAYGYGSVVWAEMQPKQKMKEAEEHEKRGLMQLRHGKWREAFDLFDKAVEMNQGNVAYRIHRTEVLIKLGELEEAVRELETVLRMDPESNTAHHALADVFLRLGQLDNARRHIFVPKQHPDQVQMQKLEEIGKHLRVCAAARNVGDWRRAMKEADAAAHAGADSSPQLLACKVEALLKLNQMYDAKISLLDMPKYSPATASSSQAVFFGLYSEAYYCFVQSQSEMAHGRFQEAITAAEKASKINPENVEIELHLTMLKKMDSLRTCANEHYIAGRYNAALNLYDECLILDQCNPVVHCNKAACWIKMGKWELAIDDCNLTLSTNPKYIKAHLRRALANANLGRWAQAFVDYEVLKQELPKDKEIAEALCNFKTELRNRKQMRFDGKFDGLSGLNYHFRPATSCQN